MELKWQQFPVTFLIKRSNVISFYYTCSYNLWTMDMGSQRNWMCRVVGRKLKTIIHFLFCFVLFWYGNGHSSLVSIKQPYWTSIFLGHPSVWYLITSKWLQWIVTEPNFLLQRDYALLRSILTLLSFFYTHAEKQIASTTFHKCILTFSRQVLHSAGCL